MTQTLLSASWYRVSDLTPRLANGVTITRQVARDRIWQLLTDPNTGRHVRLNQAAYAFVGRCNGSRSAHEVWQLLLENMGDAALTQDEIIRILSQLYSAGLVQFDAAPNLSALFAQRDEELRTRRRNWINPLVIRMRLFNPSRVLDRLVPLTRIIPGKVVIVLWLTLVGLGLGVAAIHYSELQADTARLLAAPSAFFLFWICFPPIKAIHEMAHAVAVRRCGGNVLDAGLTLMFFTPAPYVDASAANTLQSRAQRMAVSAAGIVAELAIAALGAMAWLVVEPGTVRDIALVSVLICGVSTLIVNGNPLLRFDGYYIFSDALDLPNLALRSGAWWNASLRRLTAGSKDDGPEAALGAGERKWLILYAPASLAYRTVLMLTLLLWVGQKSSLLGGVLAAFLAGWLVMRALALWRALRGGGLPEVTRRRAQMVACASLAAVALLVFALPVPNVFVTQGVVWPLENAQVRVQTAGFVDSVTAHNGQAVAVDQPIVILREPSLESEHDRLASELNGYQARQYFALLRDPAEANSLEQDIDRTKTALARVEEQISQLEVSGHTAGRLVLPHEADLPGGFAARGSMIGYILAPGAVNVRAVLQESDALLIRGQVRAVEVLSKGSAREGFPGRFTREMPAATNFLPSAALGDRAGGRFDVDPTDKDGIRTRDPVFLADLTVPGFSDERIGNRVWVRFDLGYAPIGQQAIRRARQLFLKHFNPEDQT